NANRYLSTAGAESYLVEDKWAFNRRGISVWIHEFEHPQYVQCFAPFMPYASALDLIFNVGPAAAEVMQEATWFFKLSGFVHIWSVRCYLQ
ncbi:MAG TPA: WbqC family protein, partial [Candidatus Wunengus sp. YC60]|uniref:WbqC family protein n=1 Tax=Candidatus Wunengus sp. YC60 TaxID=3367697 RepID=UPI004026A8B0